MNVGATLRNLLSLFFSGNIHFKLSMELSRVPFAFIVFSGTREAILALQFCKAKEMDIIEFACTIYYFDRWEFLECKQLCLEHNFNVSIFIIQDILMHHVKYFKEEL